MTALPRYRLHDALGYQLSLTSRMQERRFDEKLKSLGLTRISWCILLAVLNEHLNQPSEIAHFVGIDRTATSRALRQMELDGMIARKTGQNDRRTTLVEVTANGAALVTKGIPLACENATRFESKLSAVENTELRRLLTKLRVGEEGDLKRL